MASEEIPEPRGDYTVRPRINVVNDSGNGGFTKVYTEDGADISNAIQEVTLHLKVGEPTTAAIKAILVGADIDAEIVELQTRILPPPAPRAQLELRIGPWQFNTGQYAFGLKRILPLGTYGAKEEMLAEGMVELNEGVLDRVYTFTMDDPEGEA